MVRVSVGVLAFVYNKKMCSEKAVKGSAVITVLHIITVLSPHSQAAAPQLPTIPPLCSLLIRNGCTLPQTISAQRFC